jgi:hypothetical protein
MRDMHSHACMRVEQLSARLTSLYIALGSALWSSSQQRRRGLNSHLILFSTAIVELVRVTCGRK